MKIIHEKDQPNQGGVQYMNRGPDIDWGLITLQPNEEKPAHYHESMGETFYVIQGIMTFILKNEEVSIPAGSAIRLEAKETHGLKNETQAIAKLIFVKEKYLPQDKVDC